MEAGIWLTTPSTAPRAQNKACDFIITISQAKCSMILAGSQFLFSTDRVPITHQKVHFGEPLTMVSLFTVAWVRGSKVWVRDFRGVSEGFQRRG